MSKIKFTGEEARTIVYEDSEDFKVIQDDILETSRWSELHKIVVQQISTSKFFDSIYSRGLTEQQDEQPYEYEDEVEFYEVYPISVITTQYTRDNPEDAKPIGYNSDEIDINPGEEYKEESTEELWGV